MISISRYLRLHVWGVLILGILSTGFILWAVGLEYTATIVGWGLAMFWTSALLLEGTALGAERWFAGRTVSRTFCVLSLLFLGVALLSHFPLMYITASILNESRWWLEYTKPVYIELNFGGGYDGYLKGALLYVVQWMFLVACLLAIRKLFRSDKSQQQRLGRGFLILLMLFAFGTAVPVLNVMEQIMKALGMTVTGAFYLHSRLNVEFSSAALTLMFCVQLWFLTAWIPKANIRRVMTVMLPTLLVWASPFVFGVLRFGVTSAQIVQMEDAYVGVTLSIPLLSWGIFLILERITRPDSLTGVGG
ncbi:MAG: hypothetical protein WEE20_07410 [Bacteroidota bacterium]